jgi:hypothetical protein
MYMSELDVKLDESLQHYGVKGMRWGIMRNRNRPGGADGKEESVKVKDDRSNLRKNLDSMRRERQWSKVLQEMDKLTTKDINAVSKRVGLENELKTLSRTKGVGSKKDKEDYLRRENMSDAELNRKVVRLRAKSGLHKNVTNASKEQREFGEKVVNIVKGASMKVAVSKVTGKPLNPKDFYDILKKPKEGSKNAKKDLEKQIWDKVEEQAKKQNKP